MGLCTPCARDHPRLTILVNQMDRGGNLLFICPLILKLRWTIFYFREVYAKYLHLFIRGIHYYSSVRLVSGFLTFIWGKFMLFIQYKWLDWNGMFSEPSGVCFTRLAWMETVRTWRDWKPATVSSTSTYLRTWKSYSVTVVLAFLAMLRWIVWTAVYTSWYLPAYLTYIQWLRQTDMIRFKILCWRFVRLHWAFEYNH